MPHPPQRRYETSIVSLDDDGCFQAKYHYSSDSIPDLCAVASLLKPPYEITIYTTDGELSMIVEQWDSNGECGNYGGFWHTTLLYPEGLPEYLRR